MEPAALSGAADTPAAPPVRDGVVSRPGLFTRLTQAQRVVQVSAPAGSGKTVLLRSWIAESGLAKRAAWVSVPGECDSQRFWISVVGALRDTAAGSALVRGLTAAPDLDGWTVVERLLADLASLEDRIWLVIDDLHELCSAQALRQLELLIMRAPPALRFVLVTRHDLRLGLHRLRLSGELTEIRTADLRFTLPEGRALLDAAGVPLSDSALAVLYDRTEGWAAGLRLAALSLAGHPDPERFAAEFGGSERTVAEYLLAEVLERQSEQARRLLLRTSILQRVNGELADLLTGGSGGERVLQQLEEAGAFVVSLDARRSGSATTSCSPTCCSWSCGGARRPNCPRCTMPPPGGTRNTGIPSTAVRHAQAARNWGLAARLLSDQWVGLGLAGLGGTAHELLARFPAGVIAADAELAARVAGDQLARGSLEEAERYLALSTRALDSVPADRRGRSQVVLAVVRMRLARQRGDLTAVADEAQRLLAPAVATDLAEPRLGGDLRALALINLGIAEALDVSLRRGGPAPRGRHRPGPPDRTALPGGHRPGALGPAGELAVFPAGGAARPAGDRAGQQHGWADEPVTGLAYLALGVAMVAQGRIEEAERALDRAERTVRTEVEPAAGMRLHYGRGMLEFVSGRHDAALSAFRRARTAGQVACHAAHARAAAALAPAADARAQRRNAARRAGPRRHGAGRSGNAGRYA